MVEWQHAMQQAWSALRFGEVKVETNGDRHVFEIPVYLGDLDPQAVRVEIYADGVNGDGPVRQEMEPVGPLAGGCVYRASISAARPVTDYTVRAIPHRTGAAVPLENARILWMR